MTTVAVGIADSIHDIHEQDIYFQSGIHCSEQSDYFIYDICTSYQLLVEFRANLIDLQRSQVRLAFSAPDYFVHKIVHKIQIGRTL